MPTEAQFFCSACDFTIENHFQCEGCELRFCMSDQCDICEKCEECCECAVCSRTRCGKKYNSDRFYCDRCTKCEECCECYSCNNCDERVEFLCSNCETCTNGCCNCSSCSDCGTTVNETCGNCDNCQECCGCRSENSVTHIKQSKPHFHVGNTFKKNASARFIACELEINEVKNGPFGEDAPIYRTVRKWKGDIVEDGSLDGDQSFEINTAPSSGDTFIDQIEEICEALKKNGAEVNDSCGFHVHIDARDFTFFDIRKLVMLYAKIENALYSMVPENRRNSRFCLPCGEKYLNNLEKAISPKDNNKAILKNVYGKENVNMSSLRSEKYNGARYNALNVHSWIYRGTIECRMAPGTVKARDIINWSLLWATILDFAFEMTEKEIGELTVSGRELLKQIAPTPEIAAWIDRKAT